MVLLDSGSTHTILRDPWYFKFSRLDSDTPSWQTYELSTVARKQKMTFREGRARVKLPGGTILICSNAMFAPEAQWSLIKFRDLRAHGIHALTAIKDGEEIIKLMQGGTCLATACYGAKSIYEILIFSLTVGHQDHSTYLVTIHEKTTLWHWRMGHPRVTMFRRMISILTSHEGPKWFQQTWSVWGMCSRKAHPQAFALEVATGAPSTIPLAPMGHMRSHHS